MLSTQIQTETCSDISCVISAIVTVLLAVSFANGYCMYYVNLITELRLCFMSDGDLIS